jgi:hypothetical protein
MTFPFYLILKLSKQNFKLLLAKTSEAKIKSDDNFVIASKIKFYLLKQNPIKWPNKQRPFRILNTWTNGTVTIQKTLHHVQETINIHWIQPYFRASVPVASLT